MAALLSRERRGFVAAIIVAVSLLAVTPPPAESADGRVVRVFAVAFHHHIDRVASYATFRFAINDLLDDEVAPHLAGDRANLVTFPENTSLMAYAIGARGTAARRLLTEGAGSTEALASLATAYAPQIAHYRARFPGADSPGQLLQLALTDTLVRAVVETFSAAADRLDAYLSVSTNLAPYRRITGPAAALLADPEADTSYAYEATSPEVRNRNLIFAPDGDLVTIQDKAYLVPIERDRTTGLGLTGVEVDELSVARLPFADVATVISKDAWMPDINERLDQLGAELLIQPEAFSTWATPGDDLWPPDKFQRGGWWMVQQHPSVHANVTPQLTGNLGELTFDGQPLVAVDAHRTPADRCLLGQRPQRGWAAVGRWDSLSGGPASWCDPGRRPEFAAIGAALRPGSGTPRENDYAEDVVWADITLPVRPAPAPRVARGDFTPVASPGGQASQLVPDLAISGDGVILSWVGRGRGAVTSVLAARSHNGRAWSEPVAVDPRPVTADHLDNQWSPDVAVSDGTFVVSYLGFPTENWDVFATRAGANGFAEPSRVDDAHRASGVARERGHSAPRVTAAPDGTLLAAWSDLRWPWVHPQVRIARSADGGANWSASVRADGGQERAAEDVQLDRRTPGETRGQAAPSVAVTGQGTVLVAWQEQDAEGVPAVWLARSPDGGASFTPAVRLSGAAPAHRPTVAASGDRAWLAWEETTPAGGSRLTLRSSPDDGRRWLGQAGIDRSAAPAATQRHATIVPGDGGATVVFEDARAGDSDVLAARLRRARPTGAVVRVDDGPPGAHARAPTAARLPDGRLLVAWQDTRGETEHIALAVSGAERSRG
jgi:predicted amidohydrolase